MRRLINLSWKVFKDIASITALYLVACWLLKEPFSLAGYAVAVAVILVVLRTFDRYVFDERTN